MLMTFFLTAIAAITGIILIVPYVHFFHHQADRVFDFDIAHVENHLGSLSSITEDQTISSKNQQNMLPMGKHHKVTTERTTSSRCGLHLNPDIVIS